MAPRWSTWRTAKRWLFVGQGGSIRVVELAGEKEVTISYFGALVGGCYIETRQCGDDAAVPRLKFTIVHDRAGTFSWERAGGNDIRDSKALREMLIGRAEGRG